MLSTPRTSGQSLSLNRLVQKRIFNCAMYSFLNRRSKDSFDELKNSADPDYYENITVINSWRLNERHYGALVGLSKNDAIKKLGLESVIEYRRSWDKKPPKMDIRDISEWESQIFAKPTTSIHKKGLPST